MLCLYRNILYDKTSDLEKSMKNMLKIKCFKKKKYKKYISHVKLEYMPTIKLCVLQHFVDLPVHGMLTNNVTESTINNLKSKCSSASKHLTFLKVQADFFKSKLIKIK